MIPARCAGPSGKGVGDARLEGGAAMQTDTQLAGMNSVHGSTNGSKKGHGWWLGEWWGGGVVLGSGAQKVGGRLPVSGAKGVGSVAS